MNFSFPILAMPRRLLDLENLFAATIDVFDPFDEFDQELCHDIMWLRKPILRERRIRPQVPMKHRLNIDVHGYRPESLKTEVQDGKLVVTGYDELVKGDDFTKREFRKTFKLPSNLDHEKLISFVTKKGHMIIEIPYKREYSDRLEPRIESNPDGSGRISFTMDIKNLDLTKLQITLKDYDVILNYEELLQLTGTKSSRITNVKRFKLPDNTNIQTLKCVCDEATLTITAEMVPESVLMKKIPIFCEGKVTSEPEVATAPAISEPKVATELTVIEPERQTSTTSEEPTEQKSVVEETPQEKPEGELQQGPEGEVRYVPSKEELENASPYIQTAPVTGGEVPPTSVEEPLKEPSQPEQELEAEQQKPSDEEERIHAEISEAMQPVIVQPQRLEPLKPEEKEGKELIRTELQLQAKAPAQVRLFEAPRGFEVMKTEEEQPEQVEEAQVPKIEQVESTENASDVQNEGSPSETTDSVELPEVHEPVKKLPFESVQFHFSVQPKEEAASVKTNDEEEPKNAEQTEAPTQQAEVEDEEVSSSSRPEISSDADTTIGESSTCSSVPPERISPIEADLPTQKTEEHLPDELHESYEDSEKNTPVNK